MMHQVRELKKKGPSRRIGKLAEAFQITDLIRIHKSKITPEEYHKFQGEVFGA
jgi:hypothetical protein